MSNSIAPGSSADVNVRVTALTTNPNVPVTYKTIILKKNLVNGVNTLTQEMMSATNIKYVIKYDYVLGEDITVPANCVLEFDGGSLSGDGTLRGTNTKIIAGNYEIFKQYGDSTYRCYTTNDPDTSFNYVVDNGNSIILDGSWDNVSCNPNWVGLNKELTCASLAINNFLRLHKIGTNIVFPHNCIFSVYDKIHAENYNVDFNDCVFNLVDYNLVENTNLPLPSGSTARSMRHPGQILWVGGTSTTYKNLTIDENAVIRGEESDGLGGEFAINIVHNSQNILIKDITLRNLVNCGILEGQTSITVNYDGLCVYWAAEHGIYSYQNSGTKIFKNCIFKNCGQSQYIYNLKNAPSNAYRLRIDSVQDEINSDFHVIFENTQFICDGELRMGTMPYGCKTVDFYNCKWVDNNHYQGIPIGGRLTSENVLETYTFTDCYNPAGIFPTASYDCIRKLYNCKNVQNPFTYTSIVENCDCNYPFTAVDDIYTYFSTTFADELDKPLIINNSRFSNFVTGFRFYNKTRNIVFTGCNINTTPNSNRTIIDVREGQNREVTFIGCIIKNSGTNGVIRSDIGNGKLSIVKFLSSILQSYPGYAFSNIITDELIINGCDIIITDTRCRIVTEATSWSIINNSIINSAYYKYLIEDILTINNGFTYTIPNSKWVGFSGQEDLRNYISLEKLGGGNTDIAFTVTNNGTSDNSIITFSTSSQDSAKYKIVIDFTKK